ncbi:MAG: exodeoxyribonuclease VII large subunit [Methanosaeta sp. PtaB.Bin018]|nr:MAG: exodeoxyribonuclease VII large subunit [Methanosaeta sp. PtaB.Bin018]OPY46539.1 MAG: exodeoxyribonuclease VII large subunit [Methanosaeta sp. PtaU1.Bin016]
MTQIFTVTDLNERIRDRLENDPRLHDLWARGELSNYVHHRSGHRYFTLKDRDSQISCVLFRNDGVRLGFELKDGQNVIVYGDVGVYRPQGRVQLMAKGIRLDEGIGLRHLQLEALKKKLADEGLFSIEHKRSLPKYPERIGIVTSPQGAALRDVLRIIGPYPARIILSPAQVQGEGAAESIAMAVRALQGRADVVIVCRGGGSTEDLWCFNSELVARAIFECDSPVISAVGHETDFTVADFVADVRAPTPTAAAEMAVPDIEKLRSLLVQATVRMKRSLWSGLERREERLEYLKRCISAQKMYSLTEEARQRLDSLERRLCAAESERRTALESRLEQAEGRLAAVGPLATLSRGYAIVRSPRGLVLSSEDVQQGEVLELILAKGRLLVSVVENKAVEEVYH